MRGFGTMSLPTRPRRFATPLWVGGIGDEAPPAGELRPTHSVLSVYCYTQAEVRICSWGNNVIRASVSLMPNSP